MSCLFEYSEVSENSEYSIIQFSIFNSQFVLHPTIVAYLSYGDGDGLLGDNL